MLKLLMVELCSEKQIKTPGTNEKIH